MKVYVVMQYRGTEPVGKGTPVDVYLWNSERIGKGS